MLPLIVSILGVAVSAGLFWIGFERYKREVPHKGLSYSVGVNGEEVSGDAITIRVWNSGNVPIEEEDYLSPMGFNLGDMVEVQEVRVVGQQPEDLVVDVSAAPSGKIQIAPIYLNHRTGAMQDPASGLPRIHLLRGSVNKRGLSGIEEEGVGSLMASRRDNLREGADSVASVPPSQQC